MSASVVVDVDNNARRAWAMLRITAGLAIRHNRHSYSTLSNNPSGYILRSGA